MQFEELYHSLPTNGWLTEPEARLLFDVSSRCEGAILEVGCYYGRSTVLLASHGRPIYSVDPFKDFDSSDLKGMVIRDKFLKNLRDRKISNVTLFQEKVENWISRPVGFAYLDGDHSYSGTTNQLVIALDAGAEEICIHDYADQGGGVLVKEAIEDCSHIELIEVVERMAHCRKIRSK